MDPTIDKYAKDFTNSPLWLQYVTLAATVLAAIFGGMVLLPSNEFEEEILDNWRNATSSIELVTLLDKAVSYESVVERQNFLEKYIGIQIYGKARVSEISKTTNEFILDLNFFGFYNYWKLSQTKLTCLQPIDISNEKEIPLLHRKIIIFSGIFTYKNIFDHGLEIGECKLFFQM